MGCGKSKHAVETATTVVKSSDGTTTGTTTTKSIKETGGSSLIQKEVETKSLLVEDTKKETVTTKVDPSEVAKTDNVAPTSSENGEKPTQVLKEDAKAKESNQTDNVVPTLENAQKAVDVVKQDEKVKDLSPTNVSGVNVDNVVPTSSKADVGIMEVVKEDEGKRESTLKENIKAKTEIVPPTKEDINAKTEIVPPKKEDIKAKTEIVPPTEEDKIKESNLTKDNKTKNEFMTPTDNKTKTEFMTPTLSDDVVGPFEVVKGSEEVKGSKEENIKTATSDEKPGKTTNGSSNPKDENLKVEDQKLVAVASTKVETKKGDLEVTKATVKVPIAKEANVEKAQEKKS